MKTEQFVTGHYLQLIEEAEAKFILEHAEKMLKNTLETNTLIVTRVTMLASVAAPLLLALFSFAITRYHEQKIDILLLTATVGIIYLLIIIIMLFFNIKPNGYYCMGAEPKDLFNPNLINEQNASYRMIVLYVNEIQECQKRIDYNKAVNNRRWKLYKMALIMLGLTPVLLTLTYVGSIIF